MRNIKLNKKGFTLVELLAVIVILAVVMLIAVTAVGPLMTKARQSSLVDEGLGMVDAAKTAYQAEQLGASSDIKSNSSVCFSLSWLNSHGYFDKGTADGYNGSVLISYATGGNYSYKFWISNGVYEYHDVEPSKASYDYNGTDTSAAASSNCGGATGVVSKTA